jgi:alpha-amylase/alpha-mannosidase (GH57 family)
MSTSEPIHVAFVWHMHQPYYRSARTGAFQMPWARLHALKDYLDMVEILDGYPDIHQTFNLVPSLVEQLEDYAMGQVPDVYWQHTITPAAELQPSERVFVVERMCERSDHPRAKSHPRYLELAQKRESVACRGWEACSESFSVDELRDLQIWFNLAWFDPTLLEAEPLLTLVQRGRDYREDDKLALAQVQSDILARVIPAYKVAAQRGQIELSTSPYFHPILPLLVNSDSARIGAGDTILPRRRFAHPEDAWEHVERGVAKHEQLFGTRPRGMWCSEQAVGEDVLPLLLRAGVKWTISGQTILSRSLTGSAASTAAARGGVVPGGTGPMGAAWSGAYPGGVPAVGAGTSGPSPYLPYLLRREEGELTIVFRDHTLSDLIGFGYQSWDSRDAANDLLSRIRGIGAYLSGTSTPTSGAETSGPSGAVAPGRGPTDRQQIPLITIALDGENAWEYYPRDGRDFLHYLYEGLAADPTIRCVTVSEHLDRQPATEPLDWLHTGSWIGGDLRTWSGDPGHNAAWDLLHEARDLAASRRTSGAADAGRGIDTNRASKAGRPARTEGPDAAALDTSEAAWHHILAAEGSDWFWWFGEHHHTELDHVWDLEFRQHLQEVYRCLGEPIPIRLYLPVLAATPATRPALPLGIMQPVIDGVLTDGDGWDTAGVLVPDHPSTMQRAEGTHIVDARFGWGPENLYLLLIPRDVADLTGLELELKVTPAGGEPESVFEMALAESGAIEVSCSQCGHMAGTAIGAWRDVVEIALPLATRPPVGGDRLSLLLRVGRAGMTDYVFRSAGAAPVGEG